MAIEITPYSTREYDSGRWYFPLGKIFDRVPQTGDRIKVTIDGVDYILTGEKNKYPENTAEWNSPVGSQINYSLFKCVGILNNFYYENYQDIDYENTVNEFREDIMKNGVIFGKQIYETVLSQE